MEKITKAERKKRTKNRFFTKTDKAEEKIV
jgi:hypothetical protein